MLPTKAKLLEAFSVVQNLAHNTPIHTSSSLNSFTNCELYFKCENFQKTGSFKIRGASYGIHCLSETEKQYGVITHSSGNFGQALACAAQQQQLQATVVMPENAPKPKQEAVASYGAKVALCKPTTEARALMAKTLQAQSGAVFLHPSNQIEIILGNATATIELLNKIPELDVILVPVGGGGLIAGTALAAKYFGKHCEVIGVEPLAVDDAYRALQSGKIEFNASTNTMADGLKTHLGDVNFPIIKTLVNRIIRVEEAEILQAMQLVWQRMKLIIEPSSAVPLAGLIKSKSLFNGKRVGIILSGGNVDFKTLKF